MTFVDTVNAILNDISNDLTEQKMNAYIDGIYEDEMAFYDDMMSTYAAYSNIE